MHMMNLYYCVGNMEAKQVSLILPVTLWSWAHPLPDCKISSLYSIEYVIPSHFYVFLHVPLHFYISLSVLYECRAASQI